MLRAFLILRAGEGDPHCQSILRVEPGIGLLKQNKTLEKKPCSDQEHEGEGKLCDHKNIPDTLTPTPGRTPAPLFQGLVQIRLRSMERGGNTEYQTGKNRYDQRESEK